jgi:hypothetical protein
MCVSLCALLLCSLAREPTGNIRSPSIVRMAEFLLQGEEMLMIHMFHHHHPIALFVSLLIGMGTDRPNNATYPQIVQRNTKPNSLLVKFNHYLHFM